MDCLSGYADKSICQTWDELCYQGWYHQQYLRNMTCLLLFIWILKYRLALFSHKVKSEKENTFCMTNILLHIEYSNQHIISIDNHLMSLKIFPQWGIDGFSHTDTLVVSSLQREKHSPSAFCGMLAGRVAHLLQAVLIYDIERETLDEKGTTSKTFLQGILHYVWTLFPLEERESSSSSSSMDVTNSNEKEQSYSNRRVGKRHFPFPIQ